MTVQYAEDPPAHSSALNTNHLGILLKRSFWKVSLMFRQVENLCSKPTP